MEAKIKLIIIASLMFMSCSERQSNRQMMVGKTDNDNWSISAYIECDSVDMLSYTHAKYWIDGKCFNLHAKSHIIVTTNPYYKK